MLVALGLATWASPVVKIDARAFQPGELVVLTIDGAASAPKVRAFGSGVAAAATHDGAWRALIGIDLDVKPGVYDVTVETAGAPISHHPLRVIPKAFPTRRLTVDPAFVNPPPDALVQIAADNKRLAAVWAASSPDPLWTDTFVRPVPQPANSAFGTRSVFNGAPRAPHGGADFPSPTGTPVVAPNAGRVVLATSLYYTGNTIIIDHGQNLFSLFAHLSEMSVHEGDLVEAGVLIGKVGATGRVTGPHLHWAIRLGPARIDPLSVLALLGAATRPSAEVPPRAPASK
jgi:murein DD-endopeptidase MepM/ murein hydrolase activator NlpD